MRMLMLSTGSGFCSKTGSDTFRSVFIFGKEQEHRKKYFTVVYELSPS